MLKSNAAGELVSAIDEVLSRAQSLQALTPYLVLG